MAWMAFKSTIRKAKLPQHKPGSPWENGNLVATYNFAASPFLHHRISTRDHFRLCPKVVILRDVGPNGPNNKPDETFSKGSGNTDVCQELLIVGLWMLSFTCWHSRSEFKFQPYVVPRLNNQFAWSPQQANYWCGLLGCFSQRKRWLTTASQAVCNILRGETAFRQDQDNVESFSSSGSAMRLPVSTSGLAQQLFCFIQFFSSVSAARRIGIPSDLFPNLNIPMKHRQIGGQSVTFTLHKRFSIAIRCLLLRQKKSLISAVDRFFACKWKYWCLSGERRPYKSFSARPIVGLLTLSSHYWSHIHMPVHILVANCRLTVLLVHRISCAILGSQNALIKVGEVLRVWPAVIAILPSLEPQQLSNIGHN